MAQIDLKNCIVRVCDGRRATLSPASSPPNSRLTFTDADYHAGTRRGNGLDPISIAIVKAGISTPLSIVVVSTQGSKSITINVATDGGGVNTSTAAQIITAFNLSAPAKALASIANFSGSSGAGLTDAAVAANLGTGPRNLSAKIGDGNFTWEEMVERVYTKDRGLLDAVKNGDQMPVDVKMSYAWEFLLADTGSGTPTTEDALEQRGEAAAWVTTSPDNCEPYCVDIEVENDIPCTPAQKEFLMFPMFRFEDLDHDPKASMVEVSGKCHVLAPSVYRF